MVFATRKQEARYLTGQIRQWLPDEVAKVRSGAIPANPKRIMIGTYQAMLGGCTDIGRRDLLIALDAVEILGEYGQIALNAAENARLLGLLPEDRKPSPRDADQMRCFFGFDEAYIPAHGQYRNPRHARGLHRRRQRHQQRVQRLRAVHDAGPRPGRQSRGLRVLPIQPIDAFSASRQE